jgi:hypothetical protein
MHQEDASRLLVPVFIKRDRVESLYHYILPGIGDRFRSECKHLKIFARKIMRDRKVPEGRSNRGHSYS